MRRIVEVEGTGKPCCARYHRRVSGPGITALLGELFTQPHDRRDHLIGGGARIAARPPRAWLERIEPTLAVAGQQFMHPLPRDTESVGGLAGSQLLRDNGKDNHTRFRHPPQRQR